MGWMKNYLYETNNGIYAISSSFWDFRLIRLGVGYTVGPNQDLRAHMWCDVLCMSFGHRKQEKKFFLTNFHFWRLALPKTGENREIRWFLVVFQLNLEKYWRYLKWVKTKKEELSKCHHLSFRWALYHQYQLSSEFSKYAKITLFRSKLCSDQDHGQTDKVTRFHQEAKL